MSCEQLIDEAVATALVIVANIEPDQLDAPTPCAEFDVRKLLNHLLFWGPSLTAAASKESVPPPAADEGDVDLTAGDWAGDLSAQLRARAVAWREPSAWTGTTSMGSPHGMPAEVFGAMVLGEIVVHGWDLARAAPLGRGMGVYGPEVPVAADAPLIDRVVGLTGRMP